MKRTISSKLAYKILEFTKNKGIIYDEQHFASYIEKKKIENSMEYKLPLIEEKLHKASYIEGMKYYIINPKKNAKKKKLIFYLHGGSYIDNPIIFHWTFLKKLAKKTKATIILPIYLKVPVSDYKKSHEVVLKLYEKVTKKYNTDNLTIMGDSAGGGFALALAQTVALKELVKPNNLILISPWLDTRLNNKVIKEFEEFDPCLDRKYLKEVGLLWTNNDDNYLVNPIEGNLTNLPKISLYIGFNEMLYPDCLLFREKCKENDVPLKFVFDRNMYHCYPLYPISDGRKATRQIIRTINKESYPDWFKNIFNIK